MKIRQIIASFISAAIKPVTKDVSGLALIEFAFTLPLILALGCWGIELSHLAVVNLSISQYALNLADNTSRLGQVQAAGVSNMRETDINDALQGLKLEGSSVSLTANSRVTISSLENIRQSYDAARVQRIHWQRCIGAAKGVGYDSSYGTTSISAGSDGSPANSGTLAPLGMGDPTYKVMAPNDTGLIFIEINYNFKPLFGSIYVSPRIIHYTASYIVRDNRDFTQIYNLTPAATPSTCDKYTS